MTSVLRVVALATAWGTKYGGINSFNADFCAALAQRSCDITCVCLHATSAEIAQAATAGVRLVGLNEPGESYHEELVEAVQRAAGETLRQCDLLLGHDLTSGPFMLRIRESLAPSARAVAFKHMHYLSYKTLEDSAQHTESRDSEQREMFRRADVVFAVGPRLASTARDQVRGAGVDVHEVTPGLVDATTLSPPAQLQVLFAGRLSGPAAHTKQTQLAVAAFGTMASQLGCDAQDPVLTLYGASGDSAELRSLANRHANRHVSIMNLPFTERRNDLLDCLRRQSAAMMLSIHEGFGLSAWEAIGAGIPVVLSKNSGVYDLLDGMYGGQARGCIHAVTLAASAASATPHEEDIRQVSAALVEIARNQQRARRDSMNLRAMLSSHTWLQAADDFLKVFASRSGAFGARTANAGRPAALFDVYEAGCEPYYLVRAVDALLVQGDHSRKSLWAWGTSGTGKTSALRRVLVSSPNYVYVSLAACVACSTAEMFEYLLLELSDRVGVPPIAPSGQPLSSTIRRIVGLSRISALVIHVDEIPFDSAADQLSFSKAFVALLLEHRTKGHDTRYGLSSILCPPQLSPAHAKASENLLAVEFGLWTLEEAAGLVQKIQPAFPSIVVNAQELAQASRGSPRFLKSTFRSMTSSVDACTFEEALERARAEVFQ